MTQLGASSSPGRHPLDIALGGGGVRGSGLVGAVLQLDKAGYDFVRILGTSAGSVVGALLAALVQAGEPVSRLGEIMDLFKANRLADRWTVGRVPFLGDPLSLLVDHSLYQGRYLRSFVTTQLADLGVRTFADLRLSLGGNDAPESAQEPAQRYRLAVTVTDLTHRREAVLPWDLPDYGIDPEGFSVADAVVASSAIPFVFPALRLPGEGGITVLVDGGVLDDLPIGTLDATEPCPPPWPALAISLGGLVPTSGAAPGDLFSASIALAETLVAGREARHLAEPCTAQRIITVDATGISPLDFNLSQQQQQQLLQAGRDATEHFLSRWDFGAWLTRCGA